MASTTIQKNIPLPKKRSQGLTIMTRTILNSRTPLAAGIFYGVLFTILIAVIYPTIVQAHINGYLQSSIIAVMVGGHINNFSGFTSFLGVEIYSALYGLLFGGIVAYIGGAAIPVTIENGTLDLALSRPIGRTRYYLENWVATLICGVMIGLMIVLAVWVDTFIIKDAGIDWQWLWITTLVQGAFLFFAAGLGMFLGSFMNASRAAGGAAVGIIVLAYLINTIGALADSLNWLLKIGPFYYAPSIDPLVNHQLTWWYPWVLVIAGLVFGIIGLIAFNKRDLPAV